MDDLEDDIKYNIEKIIPLITCPLTKKIFYDPVIASDQNVYEKKVLLNYIEKNGYKSPMNGKIIFPEFFEIIPLKNFIEAFLKKHAQFDDLRYR